MSSIPSTERVRRPVCLMRVASSMMRVRRPFRERKSLSGVYVAFRPGAAGRRGSLLPVRHGGIAYAVSQDAVHWSIPLPVLSMDWRLPAVRPEYFDGGLAGIRAQWPLTGGYTEYNLRPYRWSDMRARCPAGHCCPCSGFDDGPGRVRTVCTGGSARCNARRDHTATTEGRGRATAGDPLLQRPRRPHRHF